MTCLLQQSVGILPAGALGVSFFYHLTRQLSRIEGDVFFMARPGSSSLRTLRRKGELLVADPAGTHRVPLSGLLKADLTASFRAGELPEIILVCPNPDQILSVITSYVELLERVHQAGHLLEEARPIPMLILSSNGIYFQRVRQIFIEKIEEATMFGRLPDLWPGIMPRLVSSLLRGVTIQTGLREGSGAEAIYRPGPLGITRLAGGDDTNRQRCCHILTEKGAWVELAENASATRLEFDKAVVNLATNLLGQLYAIDEAGAFRLLRVEEIAIAPHREEMRELTRQVFQVGQAVRAYGKEESFQPVFDKLLESCSLHQTHIPSSLQWVALRLRLGKLKPALTPTEAWLLDPLIRYARSAGLDDAVHYFETLRARLLHKLKLATQLQRGKHS